MIANIRRGWAKEDAKNNDDDKDEDEDKDEGKSGSKSQGKDCGDAQCAKVTGCTAKACLGKITCPLSGCPSGFTAGAHCVVHDVSGNHDNFQACPSKLIQKI